VTDQSAKAAWAAAAATSGLFLISRVFAEKTQDPQLNYRAAQLTQPLQRMASLILGGAWTYNITQSLGFFQNEITNAGMETILAKDSSKLKTLWTRLQYRVNEIDQNEVNIEYDRRMRAGESDPYIELRNDCFRNLLYNDPEINRLRNEIRQEIEIILGKYGGA
jgi:hypothetical protein